jgi:hypothetical protein
MFLSFARFGTKDVVDHALCRRLETTNNGPRLEPRISDTGGSLSYFILPLQPIDAQSSFCRAYRLEYSSFPERQPSLTANTDTASPHRQS